MSIRYLLSGPDKNLGFNLNIAKHLNNDLNNKNIITFIAADFDDFEKNDKYTDINLQWFDKIGIKFYQKQLIDNRIDQYTANFYITNSDVIFLIGGDTLKQIDNIKKYNLIDALKNSNSVVIGLSAGAINMNENVILPKNENDNVTDTFSYKGLGLSNISIIPHFDFNEISYNENLLNLSTNNKFICLPNDSSIRISDENEITYINDCYELSDGKIYKI